jgi:hypothetical protein
MNKPLKFNDPATWLACIWEALEYVRDEHLMEGDEVADAQWNDLCTAMAWVSETLGVEEAE